MDGLHRGPTYADLLLAAQRRTGVAPGPTAAAARGLASAGLGHGDGLAMLSVGRDEGLAALSAGLARGARFTSLHPLAPEEDQAAMRADAGVAALVYDPALFEERAVALGERVAGLRLLALGPSEAGEDLFALAREAGGEVRVRASEEDVAFVQYTSGTTGRPKGVMASHRCMAHGALTVMAELEWPAAIRFLGCIPMAQVLLVPIRLRGGSGTVMPFDPEAVLRVIEEQRITAACLSPPMICDLLDCPALASADLSSLEVIFYASTPMGPARLAEALERLGPRLAQVYASTEATHAVSVLRRGEHDPDDPARLRSCGRPVVGVDVAIRGPDGGQRPPGEIGEICVRGRSVADGYWGRPELTAQQFGDGWFRTGDLGFLDDEGFLTIRDRLANVVAVRGEHVLLRDVDDALAAHPAVAKAVAFGVSGADGEEWLEAAITLRPGAEAAAEELARLVEAERGAAHVPGRIEVVDAVPLILSGKPDRQALAARVAAR